jgi:AcrR family transcriptional regulator
VSLTAAEEAANARSAAQVGGDHGTTMSPPALNILAAAQRVLVAKGFSGLTLRAIAQESGENSAMVQYYFGNKAGLVRAMIDSVFREDQRDAAAAMSTVTSDERLPRFVEGLRTISSSRSFRVFFDVLPYALRNDGLRSRMARAYDWYRQIKREWLTSGEQSSPSQQQALLGLAELMTAVVDGLAIQEAIDDGFDMRRPYAVLELMLQKSLPELLDAGLSGAALTD